MWLETLTLQTHPSSKSAIEKLFREIADDPAFSTIKFNLFYHENSVLCVSLHLQHPNNCYTDCSNQATQLIELLRVFGAVHQRAWLPAFAPNPQF